MSNEAMYREGALCPWGKIIDTQKVANGIYLISTEGHGGYLLSRERFNQMPKHLRNLSFTSNQYFEEDISWCAVPISFPEEFCKGTVAAAQDCYNSWLHNNNLASGK